MEIGNYYDNILCESFYDKEASKIRIRTIPCEAIPEPLWVESLRVFRTYPIGTKFRTTNVKICKKSHGRIYARAENQMLYHIDNSV